MIPDTRIENPEVALLASEARDFLLSHHWCGEVTAARLAFAVAGVVGVFQLDLVPTQPGVDESLWVVVGDLPPAYLVRDEAPGWQQALQGYVFQMRRWVQAVREGRDLSDVIPVSAAPTEEHAQMLEGRLDFLEKELTHLPPGSVGDV